MQKQCGERDEHDDHRHDLLQRILHKRAGERVQQLAEQNDELPPKKLIFVPTVQKSKTSVASRELRLRRNVIPRHRHERQQARALVQHAAILVHEARNERKNADRVRKETKNSERQELGVCV